MPTKPGKTRRRPAPKRPVAHPHVARALQYARDVAAGKVLACKWARLACQRHLDDLARSRQKGATWAFDAGKAEWACEFAELFRHVKGHWAIAQPGDPESNRIRLEPFQCFVECSLWGWVERATGLRRFRRSYIELPRKNAKSTTAAIRGLKSLADEGEYAAEVFSGATTEKQAWEVFRPARLMAQGNPDFLSHYGVQVNAKGLVILANGSRFEPVIGKPGDGASPSHAIVDEFHEHTDSALYDTMATGMGARRQPLLDVITTAGDNLAGPCFALREEVQRMLDGTQPNDRLFGIIYTIDEDDDWTTEEALRKANPNYGVSVGAEWLREQQREAINDPRKQNVFKTKHLNLWVASRNPWMNMEWWHRQADPTLRPEDFAGVPCFAGVDLASKLDLTSVCRVFRRMEDGKPHFYAFWRHYLPSETVDRPEHRHYQGWAHEGLLTATDGNQTDDERVQADLFEDARAHGMEQVALDEWGSKGVQLACERAGLTAVLVPMNTKHLSEPMKLIEAAVKDGRLHHTGDPVAAWALSNVTVKEDANENIFPRKEEKSRKIDPAVALVLAMSRAVLVPDEEVAVVEFG